jgi:nucleoside 2-deoxyribosyltransferase
VKIYLAGPINGKTDDECKLWRKAAREAIEMAGHEVSDPMDRDYRGVENHFVDEIVLSDKQAIDSCDALLVNASKPSWGTAMEVMYGHTQGKPVASFCEPHPVSPWLSFHSTVVFREAGDAVRWLTHRDPMNSRHD